MSLTIVVGGQYGSEGKGKLVSHLAAKGRDVVAARCGGPNAGHTSHGADGHALLRQLPAAATSPGTRLLLCAGMQVDAELLLDEIDRLSIDPSRVGVDRRAVLVGEDDRRRERDERLGPRIGSTETGTGAALTRKAMRGPDVALAQDDPRLADMVCDVAVELNDAVDRGATVIVEGTQGAGLSLHHGPYPHVTARDTTAAGFLAEAGLSPLLVDEIVMVLRTFPIRVAGASGPLPGELSWPEVAARAGLEGPVEEHTTVTGRVRRVAEFDWRQAAHAVRLNRPTALAVHGLDYLDAADRDASAWSELSGLSQAFVQELEVRLGVPVPYLFTGPGGGAFIDRDVSVGIPALRAAGRTP